MALEKEESHTIERDQLDVRMLFGVIYFTAERWAAHSRFPQTS